MHPNDPRLVSFIDVARGSHFPIQNLPYGMFVAVGRPVARAGVRIGDFVLDLGVVARAGALALEAGERDVFEEPSLAGLFALGRVGWRRVRERITTLLRADNPRLRDDAELRARALVPLSNVALQLPVEPGGYTDFYSSRVHAANVGAMFRDPQHALFPNWLAMPVAYNGRASSVVPSGTPVRRPNGQTLPPGAERPLFGPSRKLDFELELAFVVGTGNALGEAIAVDEAEAHVFGLVLLNDWSARDLQQWENQPLGPFNSKSFATSISPWIVTLDALEPFRILAAEQFPEPPSYLRERARRGFDIALDVALRPAATNDASIVSRSNSKHVYWSIAQQLAHHTVSGCNVRAGDLMGSGTISGPEPKSFGSLLELSWNGTEPVALAGGATRSFLEDGDEVVMTGYCRGSSFDLGFGEVRGRITPAHSVP